MKFVDRGSWLGPPLERKADGKLYELTPVQLKQAEKIIRKCCCNYERGCCVLLEEDGDEHACPQQISYSVCCRWFRNVVLPAFPELEADIFKDTSLQRCVKCGSGFIPRSNRSKYCRACAMEERRQKDRARKWEKRHTTVRI